MCCAHTSLLLEGLCARRGPTGEVEDMHRAEDDGLRDADRPERRATRHRRPPQGLHRTTPTKRLTTRRRAPRQAGRTHSSSVQHTFGFLERPHVFHAGHLWPQLRMQGTDGDGQPQRPPTHLSYIMGSIAIHDCQTGVAPSVPPGAAALLLLGGSRDTVR